MMLAITATSASASSIANNRVWDRLLLALAICFSVAGVRAVQGLVTLHRSFSSIT